MRHFDKFKKIILETNFFDYVNEKVLSQYDDEKILHLITFYNKNLISAELLRELCSKNFNCEYKVDYREVIEKSTI